MPSTKNPSDVVVGAGKAAVDTVSASALSFPVDTQIVGDQLAIEIGALTFGKIARSGTISGGTDNVVLSATPAVYVGGSPIPAYEDIFQVVADGTNERLINAAETDYIKIDSIAGATLGDVWTSVALTVTCDETPAVAWQLIYATKKNMKDLEEDMFSQAKLRNFPTERDWVLGLLHGGLDSRYRASTALEATALDTPGAGAVITRDAQAVTVEAIDGDWAPPAQDEAATPDPFLAALRSNLYEYGSSSYDESKSGEIAYLHVSSFRHDLLEANELASATRAFGSLVVVQPMDIQGATVSAQPVYTRVPKDAPARLNDSGGAPDGVLLTNTPTEFFVDGSGNSAISRRRDLLLVTFDPGGPNEGQQAYIIDGFVGVDAVTLKTLGGDSPTFLADEVVNVQWLHVVTVIGNNLPDTDNLCGMASFLAPANLSAAGQSSVGTPEYMGSTRGDGVNLAFTQGRVLKWGYHDVTTGSTVVKGYIGSRGDVRLEDGGFYGAYQHRNWEDDASTTFDIHVSPKDSEASVNDGAGYSQIALNCSHATAQTVNVTSTTPIGGDTIEIVIRNQQGATITINWSGDFVFSGSDALMPAVVGAVVKWVGSACDVDGAEKYYMTRTDY